LIAFATEVFDRLDEEDFTIGHGTGRLNGCGKPAELRGVFERKGAEFAGDSHECQSLNLRRFNRTSLSTVPVFTSSPAFWF
jgi:hypothetical protein